MKNILFTSNKVHTTARIGVLFFSLCFSPLINAGNAEKPMNGIESSETTQQNKIKITGVVTDSKGESIIGANVVVKGQSNVGAITDVEGRYQIMIPSDNAILQVSYLGYVTEEINVWLRSRRTARWVPTASAASGGRSPGHVARRARTRAPPRLPLRRSSTNRRCRSG